MIPLRPFDIGCFAYQPAGTVKALPSIPNKAKAAKKTLLSSPNTETASSQSTLLSLYTVEPKPDSTSTDSIQTGPKRKRLKKPQDVTSESSPVKIYTSSGECRKEVFQGFNTLQQPNKIENAKHSIINSNDSEKEEETSEVEESDEYSNADALEVCLQESETMAQKIIEAIGGSSDLNRRIIADSVSHGRCHIRKSFKFPKHVQLTFGERAKTLKEYQLCGIHWLLTLHEANRNGILADEMGLGKTAQTCVFLNYLYQSKKLVHPSVIAAPASLLDNWMSEISSWAPYLADKVIKYHGKLSDRRELALDFLSKIGTESQIHILLTSPQTLVAKWDRHYLKQAKTFSYLVVDEAHSLKNKDSSLYKKLDRTLQNHRRLLLTGSPVQNRTDELRNLVHFVLPNIFDEASLEMALRGFANQSKLLNEENHSQNEKDFKSLDKVNNLNHKNSKATKKLKKKDTDSTDVACLQKLLAPFILRRLKSEVLNDLPKKHSYVLRCIMEKRQKLLYLDQINSWKSQLAESLRKLNENVEKGIFDADGSGDVTPQSSDNNETNDGHSLDDLSLSSNGINNKFVESFISRLRRICNHPLMMQGYYNEKQLERVIKHYHRKVEGFMGNPYKKVEEFIRKWSDYEIHQGIRHLVFLGDNQLKDLLIPDCELLQSTKTRRMIELLKDVQKNKQKALVFSHFTTYLDILQECLEKHYPDILFLRLDGSTNISDRQDLVNRFNSDSSITLFFLSTKVGGQGLNLTAASTVILMDQNWNPHTDCQAEDRVHRLGQSKDVLIYRLCCRGTVEESILRCCRRKLALDHAFGGNTEILQAAILQDSLSMKEASMEDEQNAEVDYENL